MKKTDEICTTFNSSNCLTSSLIAGNETASWNWDTIPTEAAAGKMATLTCEMVFFMGLMAIQCALLHPKFHGSLTTRLMRLSLGPVIIGWWLCYPFRVPLKPFQDRTVLPGSFAMMMILKSCEWTFAEGPYHLRSLKFVKGVPMWEKQPVPFKLAPEDSESNWRDLTLWTLLQLSANRGFRWSWGPASRGNEHTFLKLVVESVRLHLMMLPCLAFVLYSQDWKTIDIDSRRPLLALGVPSFVGLRLIASGLHSLSTMFVIRTSLEMMNIISVLPTYYLYPLSQRMGLSPKISELLNPAGFPLLFGPISEFSSLAHFWAKTWHQKFRRPFLFCGGKPAMSLARRFGASESVQKACGVMGVFAVSGLLHEFPMYAFQREPHPHPRKLFKSLPGSFLFFFVQSFGLILEPMIIPYIPKRLGGGKLWAAMFLFLTAPLFTRDICQPGGMFSLYRMPQHWTWVDFLLPPILAAQVPPKPSIN